MEKYIFVLLIIFFNSCLSVDCQRDCDIKNVSSLTFPFYIQPIIPMSINGEDIEYNNVVTDEVICDSLAFYISKLASSNEDYNMNNYIYLKLNTENGIKYLYYNKFMFKIDNCVFKKNEKFVSFLVNHF